MARRESTERLRDRWWLVPLVVLAACLPTLLGPTIRGHERAPGSALGVGLISDDGAALGYVHREGALSDWFGSEYDLRTVRFWRPLVTTTLGIQERLTGDAALPLRLFNLAGHVLSALLVVALALRLGTPVLGAGLAGVMVGLFPHQGGNVIWPVGRVDAQCVPLVLGSLLLLLQRRPRLAALALFAALATKELAGVTPLIGFALVWARDEPTPGRLGRALRAVLPLALVLAGVILWRRAALGVWIGGYPSVGGGAPGALLGQLGQLGSAALGLARAMPWILGSWIVALPFWGLAVSRGTTAGEWPASARHAGWLVGLGLVAAVPLYHVLVGGEVPREHLRTFFLADSLAWLGLTGLLGLARGRGPRLLLVGLFLVLAGQRGWRACGDVQRWSAAGELAEETVERARDALAGQAPSRRPVLLVEPARAQDGAYVLHWGLADRFREPFPVSARPVWPWRPLFDLAGGSREPVFGEQAGLLWPFRPESRRVPVLEVVTAQRPELELERLDVTVELVEAPGPRLRVTGAFAGAHLEALLVTELGYGAASWAGASQPAGEDVVEIDLRELFFLTSEPGGGIALWQVLAQAADAGALRGYLEVRAVSSTEPGLVLGAAPWIELDWSPEVRDVLLPRHVFGE